MGSIDEFSPKLRAYLKAYPWRRFKPVPLSPLTKPLSECKLALVSSAAFVLPGQTPFSSQMTGGDPNFRKIPALTQAGELIDTHPSTSFDHTGMRTDQNLAFPLDRMRELVDEGIIGSLNEYHLSFRGNLSAPGRLRRKTAPEAGRKLVDAGVDIALLVPV